MNAHTEAPGTGVPISSMTRPETTYGPSMIWICGGDGGGATGVDETGLGLTGLAGFDECALHPLARTTTLTKTNLRYLTDMHNETPLGV